MNEHQDGVDQAVARLRRILEDHERSREPEQPFHLGIRTALEELDAYETEEFSAA